MINVHKDLKEQMACNCGCGFAAFHYPTVIMLKDIESYARSYSSKIKIHISSGCRCEKYNKLSKGAPRSKHILGMAVDFELHCWTGKIPNKLLYDRLDQTYEHTGLYYTDSYIHWDDRPIRWRGGYRKPHTS